MSNDAPAPALDHRRWWWRLALLLVLACHFVMQVQNLGHTAIKPLDEVFHATVARNFLKHPLTPTLVDRPFIEQDDRDWQRGHIWLHKPPMAMWQIALSYLLLGVNAFALRLPSALLATAAVALTYLIGKELLDRAAGLVAAVLQASNHAIMMLVHGYVFSDHVDISLLFWVELSILFLVRAMRSGAWSDVIVAGIAQGLAFLSKTYPALIVTGLALVAWLLPILRLSDRQLCVSGRRLLAFIGAAVLTVAPWTVYCLIRWPSMFLWENMGILHHLHRDIEGWGAPWDRLIFDYLIFVLHWFYPAVFVGLLIMGYIAVKERHPGMWLVLAWALGVLIPHALAASKTPTATLIGWPAMWLVMGSLVSRALRGDRLSQAAWLAVVVVPLIVRSSVPTRGIGYPDPPVFAGVLRENIWIAWQLLAILGLIVLLHWPLRFSAVRRSAVGVAIVASLLIVGVIGRISVGFTRQNLNDPHILEIAAFAARLPDDAVFLFDEQQKLENKLVMFWADRTCYRVDRPWGEMGSEIIRNGGVPFLVSPHHYDLPLVFSARHSTRYIYACTPYGRQLVQQLSPGPLEH